MLQAESERRELDLQHLTGDRRGPYQSYNPVSRAQIWQWCSAMGDHNPLYLDEDYRQVSGFDRPVAPPAMMQMWTMRDINMAYAPGSTEAPPYEVLDTLTELGFPGNVAVSYEISFHRYLVEGDRAHHYTTIVNISDLKNTALGEGYFVTERVEFQDQHQQLFAAALITYFQYRPNTGTDGDVAPPESSAEAQVASAPKTTFTALDQDSLGVGDALPELVIPITHKLIVGGAAASQDYIDVHHNAPAARAAGLPDIIMNILTTSGLSARYLSDWAGPASRLRNLNLKLMAPNVPGDTMVLQGRVISLEECDNESRVTVEFAGRNGTGYHVTGSACLALS